MTGLIGRFRGLATIPSAYGLVLILLGITCGFGATIWEHAYPTLPYGLALLHKQLEHLAIALFSVGLIAVLIEFRDWQEYFQKRIAETILQQAYLNTLDRDQLIALQTNTLKAFFKVDDLDRQGSFLEFFHTRLHSYIGSPFREDVDYQIALTRVPGNADYFNVNEVATFKCKAVGASIPNEVSWTTDPEPTVVCEEVSFALTVPKRFAEKVKATNGATALDTNHLLFRSSDNPSRLVQFTSEDGAYRGYKLSLQDFCHMDGLGMKIHARYRMNTTAPLAWGATHPSHRFAVTLSYPPEYRALVNWFGFDGESVHEEEGNAGFYSLRYDSWLLPDSGMSIHFVNSNAAMPHAISPNPSLAGISGNVETSSNHEG
jgi:hypothetical protein